MSVYNGKTKLISGVYPNGDLNALLAYVDTLTEE